MVVSLTFPATTENVRLARLVAAALAAQAGFLVDQVDDLRIAVDELCTLLVVNAAPAADLAIRFEVDDHSLRLEAATSTSTERDVVSTDELTAHILMATVDRHDIRSEGSSLRVSLEKQRV